MSKDWIGNSKAAYSTIGASNHSEGERQVDDFYATEPKATHLLCDAEKFDEWVLEPACGQGHMSEVLLMRGYKVLSFDKVDRGYGITKDFFEFTSWHGDIITNPPYKYAKEFVEHALKIIDDGHKVAMFLKLTFLESKTRKQLFLITPPKIVYVSSSRLHCAMNGDFTKHEKSNAIAYAWFVWEKGFKGSPIIKWIN